TFNPDVIISDFEPFVSAIGTIRSIPVISMDNQHVISFCSLEYPMAWIPDYLLARTICDNINRFARHFFLTSFFGPELKPDVSVKATLVGPIQRKEVLSQTPVNGEHILVYIRTPDRAQSILPLMEKLDARFIAYGFEPPEAVRNVTFKKPSDSEFLRDLASSRAVITNGGHSLISEALYLGKPVYSIPTRGDFEQMLNAHYVERLGYGLCDIAPSGGRLHAFLDNLRHFECNIENDQRKFNGNERFFGLLETRIESLAKSHRLQKKRARTLLAVRYFSPR
ncbi:MAG: glycosyltransferase family protein, partial [Dehalococcoidia bacterium]|nr:glycosyltransferase family protein [Dehalococcoidia bacterium]